jgi:hypothetical protein
VSHTISLTPEAFTLVKYDAAELLAIAEDAATRAGVPDGVSIAIEVDEALPGPLIASVAEVTDGNLVFWFSGGCFEDPKRQSMLEPEMSRTELAAAFLRGRDRLDGGFEDAPADADISERQRAIWDVYAEGRLNQQGGFLINEARRRYTFRLWGATALSWAELEEIEARIAAADPRPAPKKSLRDPSLRVS